MLKGVKYIQASFDQMAPDILPQSKAYRLVKKATPGHRRKQKFFEELLSK